jgi:hypothetical protein
LEFGLNNIFNLPSFILQLRLLFENLVVLSLKLSLLELQILKSLQAQVFLLLQVVKGKVANTTSVKLRISLFDLLVDFGLFCGLSALLDFLTLGFERFLV